MNDPIFTSDRLTFRKLLITDGDCFHDMMSNPKVMDPVPVPVMNRIESDQKLELLSKPFELKDATKVWAVSIKGNTDLIGIAALLKNNDQEDEIGYRLREKYWGIGYGTEIAKSLIDIAFTVLETDLITADVWIENKKSVKILDKFFKRDKEFFNEKDNCWDRRYKLSRSIYQS